MSFNGFLLRGTNVIGKSLIPISLKKEISLSFTQDTAKSECPASIKRCHIFFLTTISLDTFADINIFIHSPQGYSQKK